MTIGTLAGHDGWAFAIDTAIDGTGLLGEVSVTVPGHQVTGSLTPFHLCFVQPHLHFTNQNNPVSVVYNFILTTIHNSTNL